MLKNTSSTFRTVSSFLYSIEITLFPFLNHNSGTTLPNSVRSNVLSLKYQRVTPDQVAKTLELKNLSLRQKTTFLILKFLRTFGRLLFILFTSNEREA